MLVAKKALLGIIVLAQLASAGSDWVRHAYRLTGESDQVREDSIQRLRAEPNLNSLLVQALTGEHKHLALDVISALKLKRLLSDLIRLSDKDPDGAFHLTMNTLADNSNKKRLEEIYKIRLQHWVTGQISEVAAIVILDSLSRMGTKLSGEDIERMLKKASADFRSAVLFYLQHRLTHRPEKEYLKLFQVLLRDPVHQVRVQGLYAFLSLPPAIRKQLVRPNCEEEAIQEVGKVCTRLFERDYSTK